MVYIHIELAGTDGKPAFTPYAFAPGPLYRQYFASLMCGVQAIDGEVGKARFDLQTSMDIPLPHASARVRLWTKQHVLAHYGSLSDSYLPPPSMVCTCKSHAPTGY